MAFCMFHERKPAAMTDEDLINVQHDIGRHEDDLDRQLKQIQALEKQVSDLKTIVKNLFVLCSSKLGEGTTVWIEMVPPGSRLNKEILMRTYIQMLRGEFVAKV